VYIGAYLSDHCTRWEGGWEGGGCGKVGVGREGKKEGGERERFIRNNLP